MHRQLPLVLQVMLLVSLAVRLAVGAPCCLSMDERVSATEPAAMEHGSGMHHMSMGEEEAPSGHDGHEGDNTANPCCSACGPTLAQQPPSLARVAAPPAVFASAPEHPAPSLEAIRAYLATGPPSRV